MPSVVYTAKVLEFECSGMCQNVIIFYKIKFAWGKFLNVVDFVDKIASFN